MGAKGSVLKRVRQSEKANVRNRHYKSMMKTVIKQVFQIENKDESSASLSKAYSTIDKVHSKGIIHRKRAANYKSKLTKHINSL